jgi:hypothetical protein
MESEQRKNAYETGRKVWSSLVEQMAESNGFFSAMFQSFKDFVKRHFVSFLVFGLVAAAIAAGIRLMVPKVYVADMTVSYVHYEKKIYADMLAKLDQLVETKSFSTLANELNLPEEQLEQIKSIEGFNIRREPLVGDLSTEKVPFYVEVKVTNVSVLPELEVALVEYMNGTEFIQERLAYMQKKNEEELSFLQKRLASVDSLSMILTTKNEDVSDKEATKRIELLQETLSIYDRMQSIKGALAFNKNIEVLDGFVATEKPTGKSLLYWLVYGFLIGIGLRLVVLIFK